MSIPDNAFFHFDKVNISESICSLTPVCVSSFQRPFIGNSAVLWWSDVRVTSAGGIAEKPGSGMEGNGRGVQE